MSCQAIPVSLFENYAAGTMRAVRKMRRVSNAQKILAGVLTAESREAMRRDLENLIEQGSALIGRLNSGILDDQPDGELAELKTLIDNAVQSSNEMLRGAREIGLFQDAIGPLYETVERNADRMAGCSEAISLALSESFQTALSLADPPPRKALHSGQIPG
jgi:hypothetical protein